MSSTIQEMDSISQLAQRIHEDIRRRGLGPGDRYLTTADAARLLGVSKASANRAMDQLSNQGVLRRHQGRGTYIGEDVKPAPRQKTRIIMVLYASGGADNLDYQSLGVVRDLSRQIDFAAIQVNFIPEDNRLELVKDLIQSSSNSGHLAGVVAISLGVDVYRYLAESAIPSVILGSIYPMVTKVPSLNSDYREAGYILTEHLISLGHKKLCLYVGFRSAPGVHQLMDGVHAAMTSHSLPPDALITRLSTGDDHCDQVMNCELLRGEEPPTAIIADGYVLADRVEAVARELNLKLGKDLDIGCITPMLSRRPSTPYIEVQPVLRPEEHLDMLVDLLRHINDGKEINTEPILTPVRLAGKA